MAWNIGGALRPIPLHVNRERSTLSTAIVGGKTAAAPATTFTNIQWKHQLHGKAAAAPATTFTARQQQSTTTAAAAEIAAAAATATPASTT